MTLVQSLKDKIPDVDAVYGDLSGYVHGGFEEQRFFRLRSWISQQRGEPDVIIGQFEAELEPIRRVVFEDFDLVLRVTSPLRDRYDRQREGRPA